MEKISVIIPIYNVESYVRQCIDSVLCQTYTHLEVLLVNDGSTDSSAKICEEYKEKDSRIRLIHKENGGQSSARNVGLDAATGDYITFIDSDDWITEGYIETLYTHLKERGSDIVATNYTEFTDEGQLFQSHIVAEDFFIKDYRPEEFFVDEYNPLYYFDRCFSIAWGKLYKAHLFDRIRFPYGKVGEDEYTTYKLYLLADKITFINEGFGYIYRRVAGSTSDSRQAEMMKTSLETIEQRLALLSTIGMDTREHEKAYIYRLNQLKALYLDMGEMAAYYEICHKLDIIEKYRK